VKGNEGEQPQSWLCGLAQARLAQHIAQGDLGPQSNLANFVPIQRHDLLELMSSEERKLYPVEAGFNDYFRDAIYRVARVSYEGNHKHNPGEPTHWARGKSDDHGDCAARHMLCGDDEEHLANAAWRIMAKLQLFLEKKYNIKPPPGAR
jgi:hypothetical protein